MSKVGTVVVPLAKPRDPDAMVAAIVRHSTSEGLSSGDEGASGEEAPPPKIDVSQTDGAPMSKLVLSVREAAEILGISVSSVRRLIKRGELPIVTLGLDRRLIPRVGLERHIEALTTSMTT